MLQRFKNPIFISAVFMLLYQILTKYNIKIEQDTWRLFADTVSYLIIGTGIYTSFDKKD